MKKIVLLAVGAFTLASCNCFKEMAANRDKISVVTNPELLTLVGNEIVTDVTVVFPEEYYNPKAIVRITPILSFEGGSVEGTPKYFQGEKVKDNYTVINKNSGGVWTQKISFPWDPRAARSTLSFKLEGKCKAGAAFEEAGVQVIAKGVNTLQQDLNFADAMVTMADNFKRVTHESASTDIMFEVNRSNVRKGELTKEQTKLFQDFIKANEKKDRVTLGNVQAKGYASPEGPETLNDKLSKARSESGKSAIQKYLTKGTKYDVASYGEDWDGFRKLVEASNMKDKAMIVQVLNMYSSAAQRDQEIKNMSAVFAELKENILPELRRTQLMATTDIQGKTDEELKAAVKNDITALNLEETLFAATLFDCCCEKGKIYKSAADRFNDARAWNNLGVAQSGCRKWAEAEKSFKKAAELSSDPAMTSNLAIVAMAQGKSADAEKYLAGAGAGAKAIANIYKGNYAAASTGLEGYNKAIADVLGGNLSAAKNALVGSDCPMSNYLRGVIAAKEGDAAGAVNYVNAAIAKKAELKDKAKADANLALIADRF